MLQLQYPFDASYILQKKKSLRKALKAFEADVCTVESVIRVEG